MFKNQLRIVYLLIVFWNLNIPINGYFMALLLTVILQTIINSKIKVCKN